MTKNPAVRVLLIDDHPLLRQGVAALIANEKDFTVCGEVTHAKQAVTEVQRTNPDIVLLDISLQGVSGIEVLKDIKVQFPNLKVVLLSMHDETVYAPRALRAGALGYIMKSEVPEKLITALRQVLNNKVYVSPAMERKLLNSFSGKHDGLASPVELLSDRELQVFTLLGEGNSSRQISEKLNMSIKTVESHRTHIREKLQVESGAQLLRHAIEWVHKES